MRSKLRISASMTALLATIGVCAAGAVAGMALAGTPAQAAETNTENGVHAVPAGQVDAAGLAKVGTPAAPAAAAPPPEKMTLQLTLASAAPAQAASAIS